MTRWPQPPASAAGRKNLQVSDLKVSGAKQRERVAGPSQGRGKKRSGSGNFPDPVEVCPRAWGQAEPFGNFPEGFSVSPERVGTHVGAGKLPAPIKGDTRDQVANAAGARRLEAFKLLKRRQIPVTVVDLTRLAEGEYAENFFRKAFTPSEMVAIGKALEPEEMPAARKRQAAAGPAQGKGRKKTASGKLPEAVKGQARDKVAKAAGVSGKTYEKAKNVVEAADAEPARADLVAPRRRIWYEGGPVTL